MYTGRIVNKVPGNLPNEPKKEKQGYMGDLSQKTVPQLNELLDRQLKLLSNKAFISKLADKGEKIRKLKETLEEELKKRNESDNLSKMLSALSVNGKAELDTLEWTGHCVPGQVTKPAEQGNSDDEQDHDPLRILATHSGAGFHQKKHKIIKPEEPLIKPSDLAVDSDKDNEEELLEEYAKHLCEKLDSVKPTHSQQSKFCPFKTLKEAPSERKQPKKVGSRWQVTAATPPLPVHGDAKLVSLQESIRLQCDQQQKLKDIQTKHAAERLAASHGFSMGKLPLTVGNYRDPGSQSSTDDEQSDHEVVIDEEEQDGGGVVIYNLVDDINEG